MDSLFYLQYIGLAIDAKPLPRAEITGDQFGVANVVEV